MLCALRVAVVFGISVFAAHLIIVVNFLFSALFDNIPKVFLFDTPCVEKDFRNGEPGDIHVIAERIINIR